MFPQPLPGAVEQGFHLGCGVAVPAGGGPPAFAAPLPPGGRPPGPPGPRPYGASPGTATVTALRDGEAVGTMEIAVTIHSAYLWNL